MIMVSLIVFIYIYTTYWVNICTSELEDVALIRMFINIVIQSCNYAIMHNKKSLYISDRDSPLNRSSTFFWVPASINVAVADINASLLTSAGAFSTSEVNDALSKETWISLCVMGNIYNSTKNHISLPSRHTHPINLHQQTLYGCPHCVISWNFILNLHKNTMTKDVK